MKIENLTKSYQTTVLSNVNFELEENKIYSLLGRNGVGKTTLLKILSGLLSFDEGEIHGKEKSVLFIPDSSYFLEFLNGYDNLYLLCDIYKVPKSEIMKIVKLHEIEKFIFDLVVNYSQGMKHQLSLVSAFLINPDILLLDEPLTSLDPINIENFKHQLKKFSLQNKIVLISTHIVPISFQLSDDILILKNKKITKITNKKTEKELNNLIVNKI